MAPRKDLSCLRDFGWVKDWIADTPSDVGDEPALDTENPRNLTEDFII